MQRVILTYQVPRDFKLCDKMVLTVVLGAIKEVCELALDSFTLQRVRRQKDPSFEELENGLHLRSASRRCSSVLSLVVSIWC